jgi:probable rRNA maturation factor
MIDPIINNLGKFPINKKEILSLYNLAKKKCKKIRGGVEINVVDSKTIKKINHEWRGQNKITDVLSFAWQEDKIMHDDFLGQIFICYPRIKEQAKEFKVSIHEEFYRMLTHGLLHLVGYDHLIEVEEKKMFMLQEKIIQEFKK